MFRICYCQNGLVGIGDDVPEVIEGDLPLGVHVISYGQKPYDSPLDCVLESFYFTQSSVSLPFWN